MIFYGFTNLKPFQNISRGYKNIETKINIYSQTGKFITSLIDNRANSFVAIEWDATDSNSNLLPNGTYLYTIEIKTENKIIKDTGVFSIIK